MSMMVLFVAAALSATTAPVRPAAVAQATATIRIVSAVTLKLDGTANVGAPVPRASRIKAPDGSSQPAKLIEFQ